MHPIRQATTGKDVNITLLTFLILYTKTIDIQEAAMNGNPMISLHATISYFIMGSIENLSSIITNVIYSLGGQTTRIVGYF